MGGRNRVSAFGPDPTATLVLELPEKAAVMAGTTLRGVVQLALPQACDLQAIVLTLKGTEQVVGLERTKTQLLPLDWSSTFHKKSINLLPKPQRFAAGRRALGFSMDVDIDLPGSFVVSNRRVNDMHEVSVNRTYHLKVRLVERTFGLCLAKSRLVVPMLAHESRLPVLPLLEAVSRSVVGEINVLRCLGGGQCHVTATLDRNFVDLAQGIVRVAVEIRNASKCTVTGLRMQLYEELGLDVPSRHRLGGGLVVSETCVYRAIHEQSFPASPRTTHVAALALDVGVLWRTLQARSRTPVPTMRSRYLEVKYHLQVECLFRWAPSLRLSLPLEIVDPRRTCQRSTTPSDPALAPTTDNVVDGPHKLDTQRDPSTPEEAIMTTTPIDASQPSLPPEAPLAGPTLADFTVAGPQPQPQPPGS